MAKAGNRERITLVCTECNEENYRTVKNKKNNTERLELNKYCSRCNKSTKHKEKKQFILGGFMEKSYVIFGYSTEDIVKDIELASKEVTGRINPKEVKVLVKRPKTNKISYKRK